MMNEETQYRFSLTELEINLKKEIQPPTFDFPRRFSVHNLSQFASEDLCRKLIFTL